MADLILLWIFKWFVIGMAILLGSDALCNWIDRVDARAKSKRQNAWKERRVIYVRK